MRILILLTGINILVNVVGFAFLYLATTDALRSMFSALRFQIRGGEWKEPSN